MNETLILWIFVSCHSLYFYFAEYLVFVYRLLPLCTILPYQEYINVFVINYDCVFSINAIIYLRNLLHVRNVL